jgi:hypothetical protein
MADQALPAVLEEIFATESKPDAVFSALLPALGEVLQCDSKAGRPSVHRCFLYLRNPQTKIGKIAYCWRQSDEYPDVTDSDWKEEPEFLPKNWV